MMFVKTAEPASCPHSSSTGDLREEMFTFAHLSDLHLCCPREFSLADIITKRLYGFLSWKLHRSSEYAEQVLAALLEDIRVQQPDHVMVTGDLTHLSLPGEFLKAEHVLRCLGSGERVTVIPGNHDSYIAAAVGKAEKAWASYMVSDNDESASKVSFPTFRRRGPAAIIGLSTARPCLPLLAYGTVGTAQLHRLAEYLEEAGRQQLFRVVLIHHPPVPGVVSWRKRLTDWQAFGALLARQGAELVLHGHAHIPSSAFLEGVGQNIPVRGVPAASAIGRRPYRRAHYCLYGITRKAEGWHIVCAVRRYSVEKQCFVGVDGWQPLMS
ncbi:MAG: metallophosphoesterase [Deltaproteobacteria bacterium]|nr:metallophosphoesterase [Candidatus Anaeroferrophillus wilburensis]MBN2887716.1 metallophosphoesterase [Deltaproteobacteria bacterium]